MKAVEVCEDVQKLREALGLTQEQLARLLGVSLRTISRWEAGESQPTPLAQKELRRWQQLLLEMEELFKPEAIARWFTAPNPVLGGKTPFEAACTPNGYEEIRELLSGLKWGIPS